MRRSQSGSLVPQVKIHGCLQKLGCAIMIAAVTQLRSNPKGGTMGTASQQRIAAKQGAEDAGKYFRYMSEFVGFTAEDADTIRGTRPIIEKHLPDIVSKFYAHLLRYPPTRQWFLKSDGTIDQEYLELRMRHLTNFWMRTASGVFDDEYARYVDSIPNSLTAPKKRGTT